MHPTPTLFQKAYMTLFSVILLLTLKKLEVYKIKSKGWVLSCVNDVVGLGWKEDQLAL